MQGGSQEGKFITVYPEVSEKEVLKMANKDLRKPQRVI